MARIGNLPLLKLLIKSKADVNARDIQGRTPLFLAAFMNNTEAVAILLANMSTAFAIDNDGNKIEDVTEHPQIQIMLKQGKMVNISKYLYLCYSSKL